MLHKRSVLALSVATVGALSLGYTGTAVAQDCDIDGEINRIGGILTDSQTSMTDSVCGYRVAVVSDTAAGDVPTRNIGVGTINGVPVRVTTSAPDFQSVDRARDEIVVYVDGAEVYRGTLDNVDINEGFRLLGALGLVDSAAVTQTEVQRTSVANVSRTISRRIQQFITQPFVFGQGPAGRVTTADGGADGPVLGLAGGETPESNRIGVWSNVNNSWMSDTSTFGSFDGTLTTVTVGADYKLLDNMVTGLAVTGEFVDLDTHFNSGALSSMGISVAPYLGAAFFDNQVFYDVLAGYGHSTIETERTSFETVAGQGNQLQRRTVTGDFESHRVFFSTNVSGRIDVEGFAISPSVGYLMAWDHRNGTTESDGTRTQKNDTLLGMVSGSVRGSYQIDAFEPYLETVYSYDVLLDEDVYGLEKIGSEDRDELQLIGGLTWSPMENVTGILEASHTFARENFESTSLSASVRIQF